MELSSPGLSSLPPSPPLQMISGASPASARASLGVHVLAPGLQRPAPHPAPLTGTVVQRWREWFGVGGRLVGPSRCTATAFQFGSPVVTQMCTFAGVQSVRFYCLWVVLARRVLNCIFFGEVCILSCRHIVKRSRSQDSHFFNIHLTSIHFTLVRLLTCHQAGLYLKQI